MSSFIDLDAITAGLQAIANLRCGVDDLFNTLTNGFGGPMVDPTTNQPKVKDNNVDEEAEIKFINEIQSILDNINNHIKKMEKSCELLGHTTVNPNLGMLGILAQDPAHEQDRLYSNLISSYRWFDRMHDYVSHAYHWYNINNLCNRNMQASDTLLRMKQFQNMPYKPIELGARRTSFSGINMPSNQIDNFFSNMTRNIPNLSLKIVRPFGSPTIVLLTLDKVLKALILLHGLIIESVVIKAINEDFYGENGTLDIWSESRYEVFRQVSENCNSATLHFSSPIHFDIAVRSWMNWFVSYQSLFTKQCRKCEHRINSDFKIPTWRDYRTLEAFHENCRL